MKNIDRLAEYTLTHGTESFMVHSIPGTSNWLICQKIDDNKWSLTLGDPLGTVIYNLGTVNDAQHLEIWTRLTTLEIGNKISEIVLVNRLKNKVKYFLRTYQKTYNKFTKKYERRTTNCNKKHYRMGRRKLK